MRLEGLMKRLRGDKTDLRRFNCIYFFLFFLFAEGTEIYGQLPLNGFCSYSRIQVHPSEEKILTLDFDNDNKTDFLLYNPLNNNISVQKSTFIDNKITSIKRSSGISITDLKPVIQLKRKELFYFAISQKDRKAALFSISRGGEVRTTMQYKFDSYPSSLAVADVNGDGNSEAIVCGNNFKGISLFLLRNRPEEIKVVPEGVYSSAQFIDLNYDGFPDVVAYDARKNSLVFFTNDQNGNFRKARNIKFDPSVKSFKTADVNSDGYMDIILSKQKGFNVLEGDSVSSFKKSFFVHTPVQPDEVTVDDYNGDGINDLAYMNKTTGEFFVQLNKGNGSYYYPILLLKKSGFSDMKSFRDNFQKKVVLLNPEGELYVFSRFNSKKDFDRVSAFGEASGVAAFESLNSDGKDLCVIDNYQKALILLTGEPGSPISKYYSVRTSTSFSKAVVDDSKKNEKIFFLYTPGSDLIEIIKYNFENLRIEKSALYVKGGIIDFKLKHSDESGYPNIYLLSNKQDPLFSIYQFRGYRYAEISSNRPGKPFIDAAVTPNDTLSLFTWNKGYFGAEYYGFTFTPSYKNKFLYKYDFKIQDDFGLYMQAFSTNKNEYSNFTLVKNNQDVDGILFEQKGIRNLNFEIQGKLPPEFKKESICLYQGNSDKRKILFIYDFGNGIFYKADLNSKSRIMSVRGSDKINDIFQYVVDKSVGKRMKIVYIGENDKCLNFKEIE
jgi:hypothetical protein